MITDKILDKALKQEFLDIDEGTLIFEKCSLSELIFVADEIRKIIKPDMKVSWMIDRNVNITNVCISGCEFCNFHKKINDSEGKYITTIEEYKQKIDEMILLGGDQLLLQGGMHPQLGINFYINLFKELKKLYPTLKLHALGPPEIVFLSKKEKLSYNEVLTKLVDAGMDSLPGAGAEILSDRVRGTISKGKCNTSEWLEVMKEAHKLNLTTSATMMFGHIETIEERIQHLIHIRDTQDIKPSGSKGFLAFIPWPVQLGNTKLIDKYPDIKNVSGQEYIRMIAISRIMLPNVPNIQASWLTVGKDIAQICLHAGANDFGSIMIEEN
ncbi:MAG: CofH family radical SAM protein, partial [Bacteroidota bacterium]|nr:CofH family radical SAM protein [Bacteroidota bacterium]